MSLPPSYWCCSSSCCTLWSHYLHLYFRVSLLFSMNTGQVDQANPWERIAYLGSYSFFLGVNYPIIMPIGGADLASGYLTRSNYVYILPTAAWLSKEWQPKLCRFSLSGKDCGVTSEVNALEGISNPRFWEGTVKHPLWFVPTFTNTLEWNRPHV